MATEQTNYDLNWEKEFPWLEFRDGKMFCSVCCKAKMNNNFTSGCTIFNRSFIIQHCDDTFKDSSSTQHIKALERIKTQTCLNEMPETQFETGSTLEKQLGCLSLKDGCPSKEEIPETISSEPIPCPSYSDLPDHVVFHIFEYLTFEERIRVSQICRKWSNIARNPVFWQDIDISSENPHQILKLLPYLPATVKYLRLRCQSRNTDAFNFLEFMGTLRERCPNLKTLILNGHFCKLDPPTWHWQMHVLKMYPQELHVLSFRKCIISRDFLSTTLAAFIPRIRVLDLSNTLHISEKCQLDNVVSFFSNLPELEELYLSGCTFRIPNALGRILKAVKNLKVLDIENVYRWNSVLEAMKFGQHLEKLYLGDIIVNDDIVDAFRAFKRLQTLFLRDTMVSPADVEKLRISCPSLQSVILRSLTRDREIMDSFKHISDSDKLIHLNLLPHCNQFEINYVKSM